MRLLITGANGFIGAAVLRLAREEGHSVRVLLQPGTPPPFAEDIFSADLTEPASLTGVARGVDAIIHLAALARDHGPYPPFERVNVQGTAALLQRAAAEGVRRFVFVSSVAVHAYHDHPSSDEDNPRDGHALPYGRSKIAGEDLVTAAHARGQLEGVVVRPALVPYGPGDIRTLPPLCRALERGLLPLVDGGRKRLSLVYVDNLAHALLTAATHPKAAGGTYLVSDPPAISWLEYFTSLARHLGCPPPRRTIPSALLKPVAPFIEATWARLGFGDPPLTPYRVALLSHDLVFESERIRKELGHEPHIAREEAFARTIAWYRTRRGH